MKKKNRGISSLLKASFLIFAALAGSGATIPRNNSASGDVNSTDLSSQATNNQTGITSKSFYAVLVDGKNTKWFLTEQGIVSLSGDKWTLHNDNSKIGSEGLKDFAYRNNQGGDELWVVSQAGAVKSSLPFDDKTDATVYTAKDGELLSNDVVKVTFGKGPLRWFGTDKGICAFSDNKWLALSYDDTYPYAMFKEYPITSIATNPAGDTLYVATAGAGVARVYHNDVDGISGASVYAQWGPIIIPSDNVYSIYVAPDGTKWFGTDMGAATHKGNNTLDNWTVYTTDDGLADNFVQAITADKEGNLWFGTKGGISVFDGTKWTTYTVEKGLTSNNILCLATDNDGVVWIGTDDGAMSFSNGKFTTYR